jgi:hypothetical protein
VATRQADCHTSVAAPLNPCGFAVWRKMKMDSVSRLTRSVWNGEQVLALIASGDAARPEEFTTIRRWERLGQNHHSRIDEIETLLGQIGLASDPGDRNIPHIAREIGPKMREPLKLDDKFLVASFEDDLQMFYLGCEIEILLGQVGRAIDAGGRMTWDIAREIGPKMRKPCTPKDQNLDQFLLVWLHIDRHYRKQLGTEFRPPRMPLTISESEKILLEALLKKEVAAFQNGEKLKPEYWMGKSPGAVEWSDYFFWSDEVRKWRAHSSVEHSTKPPPKKLQFKEKTHYHFIAKRLEELELPPDGGDMDPQYLLRVIWPEVPKPGEKPPTDASRIRTLDGYRGKIRDGWTL